MKRTKISGLIACLLSFNSFSAQVEVHAGGGISKLSLSNGSFRVTSSEVDTLKDADDWGGIGTIGGGLAFPFNNTSNFLNQARIEVNLYHTQDSLTGPVYRFGDPDWSDFRYNMSVRSTRVMLDGVINVATFDRFSLFGKAGIGGAWNRAKYSETSQSAGSCSDNFVSLGNDTGGKFAAEIGGGAQYNFTPQLGLSLEYLYAHLGKVSTGSGSTSNCLSSVSPINFNLNNQAVILSLHYLFA